MAGQTSLDALGERVRTALAASLPDEVAARRGRPVFLARVHQPPRRRRLLPKVLLTGMGALAMGAAAVALCITNVDMPPAGFLAAGKPGRIGDVVVAGAVALPLHFPEGSAIDLDPQGHLQVARLDPKAAQVTLSRGRAHLRIRKNQGRKWAVNAGPFEVQVTGTRFSVDWQPDEKRMEVVLHEGSVIVTGACLREAQTMVAPDRMVAHCAPAEQTPPVVTTAVVEPPAPAPATAPRAAPVVDLYAWRALVAQGRYQQAVQEAKRIGVRRLCAEASADQLQDLADAARLGGDVATAGQSLRALRQRFQGSPQAALAAFHLGRLAADHHARPAEAAVHFERYLHEQPQGPLVGDAWGRLLEARARLPVDETARKDAEAYLGLFPNGPYAHLARRLLLQDAP